MTQTKAPDIGLRELHRNPASDSFDAVIERNQLENTDEEEKFRLIDFLKSKLFISILIVSVVFVILLCIGLVITYEKEHEVQYTLDAWNDRLSKEQAYWFDSGLDELKTALTIKIIKKKAKNVILFVGDGMGPNTVTASRIYKNGEGGLLAWEKFPHMGILKTYCTDKQVPDSSASASALFGGVKVNYETGGVDSSVSLANCSTSLNADHHIDSIIQWAQNEGLKTGFVTTTRVMHATPLPLYAHAADRRWECESTMPAEAIAMGCKDIARQLIENEPGRNINVIMGGGRQCLVSNVTATVDDPIDTYSCQSKDGRNLIQDWKTDKENRGVSHTVIQNTLELSQLNTNTNYVLGIFANGHLRYENDRNRSPLGMPSLKEMTEAAIKLLSNNKKGFLLVVEGGLIDQAHHRGLARQAISETIAMEEAVSVAIDVMRSELEDTLFIVTSDHTHTLSINGYSNVGDNILGIARSSKDKNAYTPYTTLTYSVGGPDGFQFGVDETGNVKRRDPSMDDTTHYDYVQQVGALTEENVHGGGDVVVYAMGPNAHLFHRVHEQSYVAHVISYAARIGRFRDTKMVQAFLDLLGY